MNRVFVTGATGFLGRHLLRQLVERGSDVLALVRNPDRLEGTFRNRVQPVIGDLLEPSTYRDRIAGCDHVIHLAAATHALSVKRLYEVNVGGTKKLASVCAACPQPPVFSFVSSLAAAGITDAASPKRETENITPVSNYGHSKQKAENAIREFAGDLPITITRPGAVFGPDDDGTWTMLRPMARLGFSLVPVSAEALLSMIHVDDCATAILKCAVDGKRIEVNENGSAPGIYYVADQQPISFRGISQTVAKICGRDRFPVVTLPAFLLTSFAYISEAISQVRRKPHVFAVDKSREMARYHWICDTTRLNEEIGFRPALPLAERLHDTIGWYIEEGRFRGLLPGHS